MTSLLITLLVVAATGISQTTIDLRSQSRNVDFSHSASTRPLQTGTVLPATCSVGQMFFRSDAVPGLNLYACTAANLWTSTPGTALFGNSSYDGMIGLAPSTSSNRTGWRAPATLPQSVYFGMPNTSPVTKSVMVFDPPAARAGNDPNSSSQVSNTTLYPLSGEGRIATIVADAADGCAQVAQGQIVSVPCLSDFTSIGVRDNFCKLSLTAAGPDVGDMPWSSSDLTVNASSNQTGSDSNHPCYSLITTHDTVGDGASLRAGTASGPVFRFAYGASTGGGWTSWAYDVVLQLNSTNAVAVEFSLNRDGTAFTVQDALRIGFDTSRGDHSWTFTTCASATCSSALSTIAPVAGTSYRLHMSNAATGGIDMSVNGETPVHLAANLPSIPLVPTISIQTLSNQQRALKLIAGSIQIHGLVP